MALHDSRTSFLSLCLVVLMHRMLPKGLGYGKIGVDIGLNGDNIIPPKDIVCLLQNKGVMRARIYDANASMLSAFANSCIDLMVGVPNEVVPMISKSLDAGKKWVKENIEPYPATRISTIIVGNEWLTDPTQDPSLLFPAIANINSALASNGLVSRRSIKVSTTHSFSILQNSSPPSAASFDPKLQPIIKQIVGFLRDTESFFMVNIFPYFAYINDQGVSLEMALFENPKPFKDSNTNLLYNNLFDLQMDAVYTAIAALDETSSETLGRTLRGGKKNPGIKASESGWPSKNTGNGSPGHPPRAYTETSTICKCNAATIRNAHTFNQNLINHVLQASGTPLQPSTPITAYIFSLFNENLKPGDPTEQNFGLFYPDGTPVYPIHFCPN